MINTILFDFGDVFINLDKEATYTALYDLGVTEVTFEMMAKTFAYEVGDISTEELIKAFQELYPTITAEDFTKAWNAILLDFPLHRLQFLKALKASGNYTLLLLSNTNELHINWIKDHWGAALFAEFKNCFDGFYLSHEIHMRKPNKDPFEYILNAHQCSPETTFFIDDTQEHIETAKGLGIATWNINPKTEDVSTLLTRPEFLV